MIGTAGAAALGVGYATLIERNAFTLRETSMAVLEPGSATLRVLHISDLHMMPGQRMKQNWLRELDRLDPDLVVNTGDNLSHQRAVPSVVQALGPLLARPGLFVFGSNDYFAPKPKNPFKYFDKGSMATVSRFNAVAKVGKLEFGGFIAWLMWLALHLYYLVGYRSRITTVISWFVTFLGRGRAQMASTEQQVFARLAIEQLNSLERTGAVEAAAADSEQEREKAAG